jgi:hypothetical protein
MKTFDQFMIEAQDPRRKAFDNLPSEPANPRSPLDTIKNTIKKGIESGISATQSKINDLSQPIKDKLSLPGARSYIRQDLERRKPVLTPMPGGAKVGDDPTDIKIKSRMPMPSGRYIKPKYYDV